MFAKTVLSNSVKQKIPNKTMYIDLNVTFSARSNEHVYVEDTKDIVLSLERLFNTKIGSVPFNRSYGSSLWNLLFENGGMEEYQIAMLLNQEIQAWEPRVTLSPADITIIKKIEHCYERQVIFRVPALNDTIGQIKSTITE